MRPLTHILYRIFARGFYKAHAGLFLYFFIAVFTYFFFINVLNQTHLPPNERILYNLSLMLAFLEAPWMTGIVFLAWLLYALKSWSYIESQLRLHQHEFLLHSVTAFSIWSQLYSWMFVQALIHAPLIVFGLFSFAIGLIYGYLWVPVLIGIYLVSLTGIGALHHVIQLNRLADPSRPSLITAWIKHWRKPPFSLYLYYLLIRMKMPWLITKLLSISIIIGSLYLLRDLTTERRVVELIVLGVVMAHAFLIYECCRFDTSMLSFMRNFPQNGVEWYGQRALTFLALLLPEVIWMISHPFALALQLLFFQVGMCMTLYAIAMVTPPSIKTFLVRVFFLFTAFFIVILFNGFLFATTIIAGLSFLWLGRNYFRNEGLVAS